MPSGTSPTSDVHFRIKLKSGRVLGPLDLRRIALLIVKNQIVGEELAQEYPQGDWKSIMLFPSLADLLLAKLEGRLDKDTVRRVEEIVPAAAFGETQVISDADIQPPASVPPPLPDQTAAAPSQSLQLQEGDATIAGPTIHAAKDLANVAKVELETRPGANKNAPSAPEKKKQKKGKRNKTGEFDDLGTNTGENSAGSKAETVFADPRKIRKNIDESGETIAAGNTGETSLVFEGLGDKVTPIADQQTIMMPASSAPSAIGRYRPPQKGGRQASLSAKIRAGVIGAALAWVVYQVYVVDPPKGPAAGLTHIRPRLPSQSGSIDPKKASELYDLGVKYYLHDTIEGYTRAADRFLTAATLDPGSVKALAMLASSYLNLIDASNKDETYFAVIKKLIEMSRAKNVDLAETVIADVEFFIMANKAEAAENRIIEYTRVQRVWMIDMYYYIAYADYHRGDYRSAARYLQQFPDNKANSPKVFYLRGLLAYELSTKDEALRELERAVQLSPSHAKSRLKICEIVAEQGHITEASGHLQYLISHPQLMTAKELGRAYFLYGKLKATLGQNEEALAEVDRAISLDKENSEYLLESYGLRAKLGESVASVRKKARMYFFMGEGEKLLIEGKNKEALSYFLQASEAEPNSALPLVRIGDIFVRSNDWVTALLNYRKAFQFSKKSVSIGAKYVQALIQNYEWKEVESAIERLRGLPNADSALDKLQGDMYAKQNLNVEAVGWYKQAMSREVIDPEVYMSFGKALMATKNFAEAPLFFALALRFDPLNLDAVILTAQATAQTDSVERAIHMIEDEIQKARFPRAELYAAVAQLQMQKGDWLSALQSVNQAIEANPDYPLSYKLRAEIHLNSLQNGGLRGREEKQKLEEVLAAYRNYSDRNPSDPSGYLERFRIFAEGARYKEAEEELLKVFDRFPKYPGLHLLKGNLDLVKGQHEQAFFEYQVELKNNPNYVDVLMAIGKEYIYQSKFDQALESFNKAMKLTPQAAEPKHWSGYANFLLKNYAGAIALYLTAIQIDQGNPLIYKRLGVAYNSLGNTKEAADAFRKYLDLAPDAPDRADFERYR